MNISIYTLGCKSNQYDTALLKENAFVKGINITPPFDGTDIFVLNTCTVTARTDYQARQMIRRFKRLNPSATIVVTGCYAQVYPEEVKKMGVDYIIGNREKERLWDIIREERNDRETDTPLLFVGDIRKVTSFEGLRGIGLFDRQRVYLKIQDGCDTFCTYCIVPYARGRGRSLPLNDALRGVDNLIERGFKEIVLTGIHLGAYGRDLGYEGGLSMLIGLIEERYGGSFTRFRLSSIDPMDITDELLKAIKENHLLCHHLHIPLQSGSDRILKAMGRPYTSGDFKGLISNILKNLPHVSIGTDVIAGFPGEEDEDFDLTYNLISGLPLSYLHCFPFSRRKGTPAAEFPCQVKKKVVKERCERLRRLGSEKRQAFYIRNLGRVERVLVENSKDKDTGLFKGFTRNYIPLLLEGDEGLMGREVEAKLETVRGERVTGLRI